MNREHPRHGKGLPAWERSRFHLRSRAREGVEIFLGSSIASRRRLRDRRAFTLLEMIMVLVVIAILAGVSMPAIESALTEQAVRKDSHQLALMVKTAMIQSADQHRAYQIDLSATEMALHPVGEAAADPDAAADDSTADPDNAADSTKPVDVVVSSTIDELNKLKGPDPQKANAWVTMPDTTWIFQPGELCPATRVRFERRDSWLEISFDALTGNVVDETEYMP